MAIFPKKERVFLLEAPTLKKEVIWVTMGIYPVILAGEKSVHQKEIQKTHGVYQKVGHQASEQMMV